METQKMLCFFHIFFLCFLGLTGAGQESIEYLILHDTTLAVLNPSHSGLPLAIPVSVTDLGEVSSSILKAESWLRTHVLAHFPSTKITTIVVGESASLCLKDQEHNFRLILPSLKNLYHSLKRWGLEKDIKVSAALGLDCLEDDLSEKTIKPLLEFLGTTNSSYSVHLPSHFSPLLEGSSSFLASHRYFMKKFGSFEFGKINVIISSSNVRKRMNRKLSVMESKLIDPYPPRPTPLPEISPASIYPPLRPTPLPEIAPASIHPPLRPTPLPEISPASIHPPHYHTALPPRHSHPVSSPTSLPLPTAPELPPVFAPANPPFGPSLPPCNPVDTRAPAPMGMVQKLWCVAKPSVPAETLQVAMEYACGEGGADCREIMPNGICFYPDTVVAHASYAFNNYWQKTKRNGGTCSFGGTAMIINADPSFSHCRFVLS